MKPKTRPKTLYNTTKLPLELDSEVSGPSKRFEPLIIPNRIHSHAIPSDIELTDPLALFHLYITDQHIAQWVKWTNEHARSARDIADSEYHDHPHKRIFDWIDTDTSEMRILLAIVIIQGLNPLPSYMDYWNGSGHAHYPFTKRISLRRYQLLWAHFKPFSPLESEKAKASPMPTEFEKMKSLLDDIIYASQHYWHHGSELCIDEGMIGYQGRTKHRITLKNKPISHGYKVNILSERGYALNLKLYSPQCPEYRLLSEDKLISASPELYMLYNNLSNTEKIAFTLIYEIYIRKHSPVQVFVDNLFASYKLGAALRYAGIGMTGVSRKTSRMPLRMIESMKNKHPDSCSIEGIVNIIGFLDQQYVCVFTTVYEDSRHIQERWRRIDESERAHYSLTKGSKALQELEIPDAAIAYNYHAKEVDLHNQYRAQHEDERHYYRNWHPIWVQLINIALTNAFLIAQRHKVPYKRSRDFRNEIAYRLLDYRENNRAKRPLDEKRECEMRCKMVQNAANHASLTLEQLVRDRNGKVQRGCVVCLASQSAKRRKPLDDRPINAPIPRFRATRSIWRCPYCLQSLCKKQECIDHHMK